MIRTVFMRMEFWRGTTLMETMKKRKRDKTRIIHKLLVPV
jgi:hypothetical protein